MTRKRLHSSISLSPPASVFASKVLSLSLSLSLFQTFCLSHTTHTSSTSPSPPTLVFGERGGRRRRGTTGLSSVCLCQVCVFVKCVSLSSVCLCQVCVFVLCVYLSCVCVCVHSVRERRCRRGREDYVLCLSLTSSHTHKPGVSGHRLPSWTWQGPYMCTRSHFQVLCIRVCVCVCMCWVEGTMASTRPWSSPPRSCISKIHKQTHRYTHTHMSRGRGEGGT